MTSFRKVYELLTLHRGEEDKVKVLEHVTSNISFRGANLWILACAIVIASIGLNVNSTAVIIGAMLISPLMGPIVGAGFALGTYDFELLKKSFKNLGIATIVGLVFSALYFWLSPFKETQSELLARTSPTIYDVMIAFFGGIVGAIATTRTEKGNPIPGVAIATALMPPLCTAGYGIAIGNLAYFAGAFYLYTINCFFICIATFLIIKYLKYQPIRHLEKTKEKWVRYGITILIFVMVLPSFYLAYNLYQQRTFNEFADQFVSNELTNKGYTVIYKKTNINSSPRKIELAFLSKKFDSIELKTLNEKLKYYNLRNTVLDIRQDNRDIKEEILNEINNNNKTLSDKDITIKNLKEELDKYKFENQSTLKEIRILFPNMQDISIGKHILNEDTDSTLIETVLIYTLKKDSVFNKSNEFKLKKWLQEKLDTKNVLVLRDLPEEKTKDSGE